jgi:hypothetical protein
MKDALMSVLDEIVLSLQTSGKQYTAEYFLSIKDQILTVSDNKKLKKIINQLMTSV